MKLSSRARYALRAMTVIARNGQEDKPVNLAEVAEHTALSRRYLEQVAISLKNAGLLRAVPGKNGGHLLSRPAEDINLCEIVEAAIGAINIVECVASPETCIRLDGCECRGLYKMINTQIRNAFSAFTLADMAEGRIDEMMDEMIVKGQA